MARNRKSEEIEAELQVCGSVMTLVCFYLSGLIIACYEVCMLTFQKTKMSGSVGAIA